MEVSTKQTSGKGSTNNALNMANNTKVAASKGGQMINDRLEKLKKWREEKEAKNRKPLENVNGQHTNKQTTMTTKKPVATGIKQSVSMATVPRNTMSNTLRESVNAKRKPETLDRNDAPAKKMRTSLATSKKVPSERDNAEMSKKLEEWKMKKAAQTKLTAATVLERRKTYIPGGFTAVQTKDTQKFPSSSRKLQSNERRYTFSAAVPGANFKKTITIEKSVAKSGRRLSISKTVTTTIEPKEPKKTAGKVLEGKIPGTNSTRVSTARIVKPVEKKNNLGASLKSMNPKSTNKQPISRVGIITATKQPGIKSTTKQPIGSVGVKSTTKQPIGSVGVKSATKQPIGSVGVKSSTKQSVGSVGVKSSTKQSVGSVSVKSATKQVVASVGIKAHRGAVHQSTRAREPKRISLIDRQSLYIRPGSRKANIFDFESDTENKPKKSKPNERQSLYTRPGSSLSKSGKTSNRNTTTRQANNIESKTKQAAIEKQNTKQTDNEVTESVEPIGTKATAAIPQTNTEVQPEFNELLQHTENPRKSILKRRDTFEISPDDSFSVTTYRESSCPSPTATPAPLPRHTKRSKATHKTTRNVQFTTPTRSSPRLRKSFAKTPIKSPRPHMTPANLRRLELETWLESKGKTPSKFRHICCFHDQMDKKKTKRTKHRLSEAELDQQQKQLELESVQLNLGSQLAEANSGSDTDTPAMQHVDPVEDKLTEMLDECMILYEAECPIKSINSWLEEMLKNIPSARTSAQFWITKARIAEEDGGFPAALNVYEQASRNSAKPPDMLAEALKEFLIRMQERNHAKQSAAQTPRRPRHTSDENVFQSSAIKFSINEAPTPFFKRLRSKVDGAGSPQCAVVTPVRRSTRKSIGSLPRKFQDHCTIVDSLDSIVKDGNTLFRANHALKQEPDDI